jgi:hypothetical protein
MPPLSELDSRLDGYDHHTGYRQGRQSADVAPQTRHSCDSQRADRLAFKRRIFCDFLQRIHPRTPPHEQRTILGSELFTSFRIQPDHQHDSEDYDT